MFSTYSTYMICNMLIYFLFHMHTYVHTIQSEYAICRVHMPYAQCYMCLYDACICMHFNLLVVHMCIYVWYIHLIYFAYTSTYALIKEFICTCICLFILLKYNVICTDSRSAYMHVYMRICILEKFIFDSLWLYYIGVK
jgi:hypothetical protein